MNTMKHKTIMVCGGHLTPAVAVIEELTQQYPENTICFVGREYVFENNKTPSEERDLITSLGVEFLPIKTGRSTMLSFPKFFQGCIQAWKYIKEKKPDIVVSFGGYIALPVVCMGRIKKIPCITHEQTRSFGRANKLISVLAQKVAISYRDTNTNGLQKHKVVYTGIPLRSEILKSSTYEVAVKKPFLFIVGGATGSESINSTVFAALPTLLRSFTVVHQVGKKSYTLALSYKQSGYIPYSYVHQRDYSYFLNHAAMVIGRSGANTTAEIAAVGQLAVFIPLPWAMYNEQYENAKKLVDAGSAVIIAQDKLTKELLIHTIENVHANEHTMRQHAKRLKEQFDRNGAKNVVYQISTLV